MSDKYNKVINSVIKHAKEHISSDSDLELNHAIHLVLFDLVQSPYFNNMYDFLKLSSVKNPGENDREYLFLASEEMNNFLGVTNQTLKPHKLLIDESDSSNIFENHYEFERGGEDFALDLSKPNANYLNEGAFLRLERFRDIVTNSKSFYEVANQLEEEASQDPEFFYYIKYFLNGTYSYSDEGAFLNIIDNYVSENVIRDSRFSSTSNLKLKKNVYSGSALDSMKVRDLFFYELNTLIKSIEDGEIKNSKDFWNFVSTENFVGRSANCFIGGQDPRISYLIRNHNDLGRVLNTKEEMVSLFEGYEDLYRQTLCGKFEALLSGKNILTNTLDDLKELASSDYDLNEVRREAINEILNEVVDGTFFQKSKDKLLHKYQELNVNSFRELYSQHQNLLDKIKASVLNEFPLLKDTPGLDDISTTCIEREFAIDDRGMVKQYMETDYRLNPETGEYEYVQLEGNPIRNFVRDIDPFTLMSEGDIWMSRIGGERNLPYLDDEYLDSKWGGNFIFLHDGLGIVGYAMYHDDFDLITDHRRTECKNQIVPSTKVSYFGVSEMYRDNLEMYERVLEKIIEHSGERLIYLDCEHETVVSNLKLAVKNMEDTKDVMFYVNARFGDIDGEARNVVEKGFVEKLSENLAEREDVDNNDIKSIITNTKNMSVDFIKELKSEIGKYPWDRDDDKIEELVNEVVAFQVQKPKRGNKLK